MKIKETISIETNHVTVYVRIDYVRNNISLVEPFGNQGKFTKKNWVFADREDNFMQGWRNILEAIKVATIEAEKRMGEYREEQDKIKEENIIRINEMLNEE